MKKNLEKGNELMEKVVSLAKRRGFVYPGSEIYGGLQNSWDYGPLGAELKKNIKDEWWSRFVRQRADMVGLDAALIMNPKVWEASGHLKEFSDPLVECKKCHSRYRADNLAKATCPNCSGQLTAPKQFNLMLKTFLGAAQDDAATVYFRPETAQSMFVQFKNVLETSRKRIPFGIAQVGKAFRNEITPGNFIFRTREFEQMEIEYFVRESEWEQWFNHWLNELKRWIKDLGVKDENVEYVEVAEADRAHYSKKTVDIEYKYPFGQKELYGLAYRTDYDLKQHMKATGADLHYTDPQTNEKFVPHVIEPSLGVDRSVLVALLEAYSEDGENKRAYLKLPKWLAPYKVAVFPLLANKPELVKKAKEVFDALASRFTTAWDDRGNVGKRYYSQDEIGTPFCITIDFDTLGDGSTSSPQEKKKLKDTVTVRDRDSLEQERVKVSNLAEYLEQKLQ